ncbi:MAG: FtsX-like permease family protein [SAR202 cluster bacterium]|jgi:ABC-type lipoprotein release transport system permease subunit|nr:hypothetical protein [Chloroflexota bacterium]MDP6421839.1 FtsX-like permease family protein [SAR202 cluster bacterium]HAL49636.1 hypothetical protein [Dehalococcoidia bacterium]MDP6662502.1 FtsX-like permease family protein [SAR202 cluster bacterium]MQG57288.1 FtsX-like permease family protein [SAR202 cluster bacterium]|tara:strand:- start:3082 stop:6705 length:3624 start_codon:yes stop_codon:yes gene_type:complete
MEEIFGLDMDYIVVAVAIGFGLIVLSVGFMALLNRIFFKIGLRNIPRRPGQTALIVVGLMLSTLIVSSALGTGDTLNHSIRSDIVSSLGEIDEILTANQGSSLGLTGSSPYFPEQQLTTLREQLGDFDKIDAMIPMISERAPIANPAASKSVGLMNITGIDPETLGVFGPLTDADGAELSLTPLVDGDVFINVAAAEELDADVGAELRMFLSDSSVALRVAGVVSNGGLAGRGETTVISLDRAQAIFDKPDRINSVAVSNIGDEHSGADHSEAVTEQLRLLLTDSDIAAELKNLLDSPSIIEAVRARAEGQSEKLERDLLDTADLITSDDLDPRLISLLADDDVSAQVMLAVEPVADPEFLAQLFLRFASLRVLTVQDIKADLLDLANMIASAIMSIFIIFGLFSMIAGVMLIFLIFVMLAAERKPEMGISRAVGMKRRHLIQSFVYEGLAYDLISALVGALLGIAVGLTMVTIMASIFANEDDGFQLVRHYRWQSFVVAYCIGVVLTFVTVFFSSYRASRLNIVAAIRDLPDAMIAAETREPGWRLVIRALGRPFIHLVRAFRSILRLGIGGFVGNLVMAVVWFLPPVWLTGVSWAIVRAVGPALGAGWLTVVLGVLLAGLGLLTSQAGFFTIGVTVAVIGIGLSIRRLYVRGGWSANRQARFTAIAIAAVALFWLVDGIALGQPLTIALAIGMTAFEVVRQAAMRRDRILTDTEDRNAYTFIGLTLVLYWGTPFDSLDWLVPELESNIEMFFISGICLVAASVWVIVYNADLITNALTAVFGGFSRIRPSLKTAVAYPLNSRLRTGLTLAMLALVIFTLIVMSNLTTAFSSALEDIDSVTGEWDIVATVSYNNPIRDIDAVLPEAFGADTADIQAVGGYTSLPIEVRQIDASVQEWKGYQARGATMEYLEATGHGFALTATEFGETKEEIWKALREDPTLAVIDSIAVPVRSGGGFVVGGPSFKMEGFFVEDDEMPPIEIEIREPRSGAITKLTVIAVMDLIADQFGVIMFDKSALDAFTPEKLPLTTYRFRLADGADAAATADRLDAAFLEHGLESTVLADEIEESRQANVALNRLLQGFMASGLLVGIAALGVISLRSVVERRAQIGVLRAIGYRRSMVLTSFLMESSFIALLGIFLGVALGTLLSYNLVSFLGEQVPGLKFDLPWVQLGVIVLIAYVFSLLTTYLPAQQASRIYPAQALRYE